MTSVRPCWEVQVAVTKAAADARKRAISVPLTKFQSFPHRVTIKGNGGAQAGGGLHKCNPD